MDYWGEKFKVFIIREGKLIVQTWIQHFPTRTIQALEVHANEVKTGLISPDAEVLLDEKEVSICGKSAQPIRGKKERPQNPLPSSYPFSLQDSVK